MNSKLNVKDLKEHDSVSIKNPTSEDFSWKFNGENYTVGAGEEKSFSKYVAFHLGKHLSTKIIVGAVKKEAGEKALADAKSPFHVRISQLSIYDTPERRIALHKMFNNVELVVAVIAQYPFKGFIGEMDIYKKYLEDLEKSKEEDKTSDSDSDEE